jgi:lipoyl(octanoyl) transferase
MNIPSEFRSGLLRVRWLGTMDYESVQQAMEAFTLARTEDSEDEIWLVEHLPVYTLGMNCKDPSIIQPNDIPVVKSDRGGQITYHGPGQIVIYVLLNLRRVQWGIKRLVQELEQAVIDLLAKHKIQALRREGAPGVYVDDKKIAALGLRVRRGCSYHGLAINVDMNLEPFSRIDPCGYPGLEATQLSDLEIHATIRDIGNAVSQSLAAKLGYNGCDFTDDKPDLIRNA